jgi:hypothetical protein
LNYKDALAVINPAWARLLVVVIQLSRIVWALAISKKPGGTNAAESKYSNINNLFCQYFSCSYFFSRRSGSGPQPRGRQLFASSSGGGKVLEREYIVNRKSDTL